MNDNVDKNLNMKSLNDSELEEVSGGVINLELKSESEPSLPVCCDYSELEEPSWFIIRNEKLYFYCETCKYWTGNSCEKGHF